MVRVLTHSPGDANACSSSRPSGIVMRTRAQLPESKSLLHHCVMPEGSCLCSFIWKLGVDSYQLPLYKMLVGKRVSRCKVLSPHLADRTCLAVLGPIKGWYYYRIRHKRQQRLREVKDGPRATELPPAPHSLSSRWDLTMKPNPRVWHDLHLDLALWTVRRWAGIGGGTVRIFGLKMLCEELGGKLKFTPVEN